MSQVALLIPAAERRIILINNYIANAQPYANSYEMQVLMIIYKEYVEPTLRVDCNLCYDRVLKNFRSIQEHLIQLEKEYQLLNAD